MNKASKVERSRWKKCLVTLALVTLLPLAAACSKEGNSSGESPEPTPDFSQITNKYPIPDPVKTPEEIMASTEDVTVEEVQNAMEAMAYSFAKELLGDNEVVSAKFVSISTAKLGDHDFHEPYYTKNYYDQYPVYLNMILSAGDNEAFYPIILNLPDGFGAILESFGAKKTLIDQAFRDRYEGKASYAYLDNYAYDNIVIDKEFICNVTDWEALKEFYILIAEVGGNILDYAGGMIVRPE